MIIIRHAWLNLKRNRNSHLKTGCFMLVILLVVYSLVQCYQLATAYYTDYQEQAATVVKGVQDLNQTGQAKEFNLTDYEKLKNQAYVKQAQFVGEGVIATSLVQPKENNQEETAFSSFSTGENKATFLPIILLDKGSLKKLLTRNEKDLQGTIPDEKNTCVVSDVLAKANRLKVNDILTVGTKGQKQKIKIAGIAKFSTDEWLSPNNGLLISWETGESLKKSIVQTISTVTFQLTSKKEIVRFKNDLKKMESFKDYVLISQSWAQGMLQSFKDTIELLFNGLIVTWIVGIVPVTIVWQQTLRHRQDFYSLYLMGMPRQTLVSSSLLEHIVLMLGVGAIACFAAQHLSRWMTSEWLLKIQKDLMKQDPLMDWLIPQNGYGSVSTNSWVHYLPKVFLGICLLILLVTINLQVAKVIQVPYMRKYANE